MNQTIAILPAAEALSIVIPAHYAGAGVALFCAMVALVGFRSTHYRAFIACCICVIVAQLSQIDYYQAQTVAAAARSLMWQTAAFIAAIPALFLFFASYTGQRRIAPWFISIFVACAVILAIHFSLPFGVRFVSLQPAAPFVLPWGETLARYKGEASAWNALVRLSSFLIFVWAVARSVIHYRNGHRRAGILLGVYLLLQSASLFHSTLIDFGAVQSIYTAGFGINLLALLFSVNLVLDLRDRTIAHEKSIDALHETNRRLAQAEQEVRQLVYRDPITGLPNRNQFRSEALRQLQQAEQGGQLGAMVLLDLDHFRIINDALGHDTGNAVLLEVATRLKSVTGDKVFIGNLGGDSFVAILPLAKGEEPTSTAMTFAQQWLASISPEIQVGDHRLHVAASVGIAMYPQAGAGGYTVFRQAEMAVYDAKARGRHTVRIFHPDMGDDVDLQLNMQRGLRTALENRELRLNFQPITRSDGSVHSIEVLLRWQHPELGMVSPAKFIPVAEQTGMIHAIGQWVLQESCACIARWRRDGIVFGDHVAINVSAWELMEVDFVARIKTILDEHDIDPRWLMIEVTESALLFDLEDCIAKLVALRALGVRVALDDFGTGYSSLNYLHELPLDTLKIDRSFVTRISAKDGRLLVGSIVTMAQHLGLEVVAEGVESLDQQQTLHELGCNIQQGYLVCAPLDEAGLHAFLRTPLRASA